MRRIGTYSAFFSLLVLAGCSGGDMAIDLNTAETAAQQIDTADIMHHVERLASDAFGGRSPATPGEDSTVAYLIDQFRSMGLEPGNPDGSWTQPLTLVGIRSQGTGAIDVAGTPVTLSNPDNFISWSYRDARSVDVDNSELVFVGYGVEAPEFDWDDYAGQDMTGKTLVMLVNDPPVQTADGELDPDMFNGEAMTYYGRWTYKYQIGAEKGADGVIIIHETGPAGYPWEVVTGSWGTENFDIVSEGGTPPLKVEAWITRDKAEELFAAAGYDFDAMKERARTPGFEPVDLGATADFHVDMTRRTVQSRNVVAKLAGSETPDEYVVYTAHWDHLGTDPSIPGDGIYNGAVDNGTGVAGLLELAQAFTALPTPPRRSILFMSVTSEEQGLLGTKFYAENPLYPLDHTLADINMDALNTWGTTEDVVVIGWGASTLEQTLATYAALQDRTLTPDPESEKGYYYRSDHFEFAKKGVPALYIDTGTRYQGHDQAWGEEKREAYVEDDYHKPSDEIKPDWDLSGAVEDLQLLFFVGYDVAQNSTWPTWYEGNEFKAARDAMMGGM